MSSGRSSWPDAGSPGSSDPFSLPQHGRGPSIGCMQRLSGLDASFLYLESPQQPLHVCSILELDASTIPGGYTFEGLKEAFSTRVRALPTFREKLADSPLNLDHPVWVDDDDFDLD